MPTPPFKPNQILPAEQLNAAFDALNLNIQNVTDVLASDAPGAGGSRVGLNTVYGTPFINVQKWLDGGAVLAGKPSDNMFSNLQDAIREGSVRQRAVNFLGNWFITQELVLPLNTTLCGHGENNSQIAVANGANCLAIVLEDTSTLQQCITLANFTVNGNKANQTVPLVDVTGEPLYLVSLSNSQATGGSVARSNIHGLTVINSFNSGLNIGDYLRGTQGARIKSYFNNGVGIRLGASDSQYAVMDSGSNGLEGFLIERACTYAACKSWRPGQVDATRGSGFRLTTTYSIGTGLWAQECAQDHFLIESEAAGSRVEGVGENCARYALNIVGANNIEASISARDDPHLLYTTLAVTVVSGSPSNCNIEVNNLLSSAPALVTGSTVSGNNFKIAGRDVAKNVGNKSGTFGFSTLTYGLILMNAVGSLVISAPIQAYDNAEIEFQISQGGTGGNVVTFDPVFKKRIGFSAVWGAATTLLVKFRYDAVYSVWRQLAFEVEVPTT